jgi:hypothetical protein
MRPSRVPPLGRKVAERVVALTLGDPRGEMTHWPAAGLASIQLIGKDLKARVAVDCIDTPRLFGINYGKFSPVVVEASGDDVTPNHPWLGVGAVVA